MKKICVFCGSRAGNQESYKENAKVLGKEIVRQNCSLVYGGARIGLMGEIANAVLGESGNVTGIITELLYPIEGHSGLSELKIVPNMHDRKFLMYSVSDAFVIMPGGFGTMDEFFETLTWSQLNIHTKPIGILDVDGYYQTLNSLFEKMIQDGFVAEKFRNLYFFEKDPRTLLQKLLSKI
jgi:uncharacterized protein (TIGR00730 family)